jgi:hypothetical protein
VAHSSRSRRIGTSGNPLTGSARRRRPIIRTAAQTSSLPGAASRPRSRYETTRVAPEAAIQARTRCTASRSDICGCEQRLAALHARRFDSGSGFVYMNPLNSRDYKLAARVICLQLVVFRTLIAVVGTCHLSYRIDRKRAVTKLIGFLSSRTRPGCWSDYLPNRRDIQFWVFSSMIFSQSQNYPR